MRQIEDFVSKLNAHISLNENFVIKKEGRYFLVNEKMKKLTGTNFFYAGTYLGKTKNGRFFPSFNLLYMIAEREANKAIVNKKSEWLFICGRDIFKEGITRMIGSFSKNDYVLIMNKYEDCLGFGRILDSLKEKHEGVLIKNILNIGDFLKREKTPSRL